MRICLLQTNIKWGDPRANMAKAAQLMDCHPGADLYLLPEMWATGFQTSPDDDTVDESIMANNWMTEEAMKRNICIGGSLIDETGDGGLANTFLIAMPGDEAPYGYSKRHLFTPGGEAREYEPGHKRVIAQAKGVRILLQICYDLRFPVFSRNRGEYDLAVYVANWPESRQAAWETLLRARAIENQCYVCGVNRVGDDPQCHYAGGSMLIDPYGRTLLHLDDKECAAAADIDMGELQRFRKKFPVLEDADAFTIKGITG